MPAIVLYYNMSRIAIPVVLPEGLSSAVSDHFARSECFALLEADEGRIASAEFVRNPGQGEAKAAEFLVERGVDAVLAGRIGSCMTRVFMDRGVRVFTGAGGTVKQAVEDYEAGKLTEAKPNPYQL